MESVKKHGAEVSKTPVAYLRAAEYPPIADAHQNLGPASGEHGQVQMRV